MLDILFAIMGRNAITLLPSLQRRLSDLGENIRLARLRRETIGIVLQAFQLIPTMTAL